ncbi:MAG: tRNA lysidine(34) synthetase TilS [Proteobacteria bacterium]|nr:MAG: tRNA lysidine(34) synthetase TilS [Pseudomonadota bacterium]
MRPPSDSSDSNTLTDRVTQTILKYRMLSPKDRVLVGVSGGPDSMALLHLLDQMAVALDIRLGVAHLNHGLRGEAADEDARLVYRTASHLGHPYHHVRARTDKVKRRLGISLEAAAHRVRYAFFRNVMIDGHYNKLALGHHMDDNAEQMLMAILRGTGSRGLAGIAPVRDKRIVRPLIEVRRSDIETYVRTREIPYCEDASNADQQFDRNRVRHHLLPLLTSDYNPRTTENLNRLADIMREESEWTEALVDTAWEAALRDRKHHAITLSSQVLSQAHIALARRLIRRALESLTGTIRQIGYIHIQTVLNMITNSDGSPKTCHLPGGIRIRTGGQSIEITAGHGHGRRQPVPHGPISGRGNTGTTIHGPFPAKVVIPALNMGLRFHLSRPHERLRWSEAKANRACLDFTRLHLPLSVRLWRPGDRFSPLGAGGSQKIKKYFIDHHVPRDVRTITPVLTDRRRILWLIGQRIDDNVKITPETSRVLVVEFFLIDTI